MSLVTAIRSLVTPTKYYQTKGVFITKELCKDGSTRVFSFDRNNNLVKSVHKKPVDVLNYDPIRGYTLTVGHITTVKDFPAQTETSIKSLKTKYERPAYSSLDSDKKIMDAGDFIYIFNKIKNKNGICQELFNLQSLNGKKECIRIVYDNAGKPLNVKNFVV